MAERVVGQHEHMRASVGGSDGGRGAFALKSCHERRRLPVPPSEPATVAALRLAWIALGLFLYLALWWLTLPSLLRGML